MNHPLRPGWIFSRNQDIVLFWGPLFFALAFWLAPHADSLDFIINVVIADQIFNWSHVLATYAPLARLRNINRISNAKIVLTILAIGAGGLVFFHFMRTQFYIVLAYIALTHILRQQYGWIMVSRRKAGEPDKTRIIDVIETWNIFLFPILYWHGGFSQIAKRYFAPDDLAIQFPSQLIFPLHVLHWLIHAWYFSEIWRKPEMRNPAKISILAMSWLWLYGSIVIFQNSTVFWVCLLIVHGAPYIVYTHLRNPNFRPLRFGHKALPIWFLFVLQIFILGLCWRMIGLTALKFDQQSDWVFLIWWPLLCHYAFDKFIWTAKVDRPAQIIANH